MFNFDSHAQLMDICGVWITFVADAWDKRSIPAKKKKKKIPLRLRSLDLYADDVVLFTQDKEVKIISDSCCSILNL